MMFPHHFHAPQKTTKDQNTRDPSTYYAAHVLPVKRKIYYIARVQK